jgi:hypothetical protein
MLPGEGADRSVAIGGIAFGATTALPGIKINTSDKINMDFTQMRLRRWTGTRWDQFSDVLDAASE